MNVVVQHWNKCVDIKSRVKEQYTSVLRTTFYIDQVLCIQMSIDCKNSTLNQLYKQRRFNILFQIKWIKVEVNANNNDFFSVKNLRLTTLILKSVFPQIWIYNKFEKTSGNWGIKIEKIKLWFYYLIRVLKSKNHVIMISLAFIVV